uniref:Uncharacterized protein n=1 Tax=Tetranychus urticae TaxID=32264 RepID=T1KXF7_TETUR
MIQLYSNSIQIIFGASSIQSCT